MIKLEANDNENDNDNDDDNANDNVSSDKENKNNRSWKLMANNPDLSDVWNKQKIR